MSPAETFDMYHTMGDIEGAKRVWHGIGYVPARECSLDALYWLKDHMHNKFVYYEQCVSNLARVIDDVEEKKQEKRVNYSQEWIKEQEKIYGKRDMWVTFVRKYDRKPTKKEWEKLAEADWERMEVKGYFNEEG